MEAHIRTVGHLTVLHASGKLRHQMQMLPGEQIPELVLLALHGQIISFLHVFPDINQSSFVDLRSTCQLPGLASGKAENPQ